MKKIHLYLIYKHIETLDFNFLKRIYKQKTNTTVAQNNGPGNDYQGHGHNF